MSHSKRKLKISSLLPLSLIVTNCPRGLSIPDRSVSPNYCAAYSLAPINVHLLTPCIHKLLQGRLYLPNCSMIIRWLSCDSYRTDSLAEFHRRSAVLTDCFLGTKTGTCNLMSSVILFSGSSADTGPHLFTSRLTCCRFQGAHLFNCTMSDYRLMCWIHSWTTVASSIDGFDRSSSKFRLVASITARVGFEYRVLYPQF